MKKPLPSSTPAPQWTWLFRCIALLSRLQLRYLLSRLKHPDRAVRVFVLLEGAAALGVLSAVAYWTQLPLLFPPLGPSAFILFRMPMAATASPRAIFLAHLSGLAAGFLALTIGSFCFPGTKLNGTAPLDGSAILVLSLAMGMISFIMIWLRCIHPPAAATALIVAMGSITSPLQAFGFLAAVILLITLAFIFNRLLGGLPYPTWRHDPDIARHYGELAGLPATHNQGYWQQMVERIFSL